MSTKPKKSSAWRYALAAVVSGAYDVATFFGFPPNISGPIAKTLGFLIFALALLKIIVDQRKELESLRNPEINFSLSPKSTVQRDLVGWDGDANYVRVAVQNESAAIARDCCLVIESFTFLTTGLNEDTPLPVKDEGATTKTDIPPSDTKQFDLFVTIFAKGTSSAIGNRICAPNQPFVTSGEGGYSLTLRVTGGFDTRRYSLFLYIDSQKQLKVTRIDQI